MKYLFIALVALGLFATLASAEKWERSWMRDAKINAEGLPPYRVASTGGSLGTLTTLTECPDVIAHSFSSITNTVDTVLFPKGCVGTDAIWLSQVYESEDSAYVAATDDATVSWAQDTLFFEKSSNGTGIDNIYAIRIR